MTAISILASAVTIAMFVSQLSIVKELRRAQKTKTTVPMLQFLVSFLSSVLWLKYGLIKDDHTVTLVNGIGAVVALYIIACFWRYSPSRGLVETRFLITALCAVGLISYVDHSRDPVAVDAFSLVCCLMTLMFMGSPLSQIGNVVKMRDASVLLPSVAALAFANNVLWSAYGYMRQDPFMLFPNSIGAILCAVQLALIAFYGRAAANLPLATAARTNHVVESQESLQMTSVENRA